MESFVVLVFLVLLAWYGFSILNKKLESIMTTQEQLVTALTNATALLKKIGEETTSLLVRISELQTAVEAAQNVSPEVEAAVTALLAQAAVVDGLVPDLDPVETSSGNAQSAGDGSSETTTSDAAASTTVETTGEVNDQATSETVTGETSTNVGAGAGDGSVDPAV